MCCCPENQLLLRGNEESDGNTGTVPLRRPSSIFYLPRSASLNPQGCFAPRPSHLALLLVAFALKTNGDSRPEFRKGGASTLIAGQTSCLLHANVLAVRAQLLSSAKTGDRASALATVALATRTDERYQNFIVSAGERIGSTDDAQSRSLRCSGLTCISPCSRRASVALRACWARRSRRPSRSWRTRFAFFSGRSARSHGALRARNALRPLRANQPLCSLSPLRSGRTLRTLLRGLAARR